MCHGRRVSRPVNFLVGRSLARTDSPQPTDRSATGWRFARAVDRIDPAITAVLVEHATGYWQRPLTRHVVLGQRGDDRRVVWSIDGVLMLEFRFAEHGPSDLVVHEFSLFGPLRKTIRTGHVRLRFATSHDASWRE